MPAPTTRPARPTDAELEQYQRYIGALEYLSGAVAR